MKRIREKIIRICYINLLLFLCMGCPARIEYRVRARFIYINETHYEIKVGSNFILPSSPFGKHIIEGEDGGSKDISWWSYYPPIGGARVIIIYDNVKCDTIPTSKIGGFGEGPTGIQNYDSKQLGERYYEFTYRFTEEEYLRRAKDCL